MWYRTLYTMCPDKNQTPKEVVIMQQQLVRFVWNFRHMNNRTNQQEMILLIEMYQTLPILWTFKMQRSTYKYSNTAQYSTVSDKQSVKQVQATADVQNVLLVLERMTIDGTPLLDGPVDDLLIKHLPLFNQMCLEVIDVTNAGVIHPPF